MCHQALQMSAGDLNSAIQLLRPALYQLSLLLASQVCFPEHFQTLYGSSAHGQGIVTFSLFLALF